MVGSSQHELTKFLAVTLLLVLELYSSFCIQNSFSFAELIRQFDQNQISLFSAPLTFVVSLRMYPWMKLFKFVLTLSILVSLFPLIFLKQYLFNLCKWLLVVLNSASTAQCTNRLIVLPWVVR